MDSLPEVGSDPTANCVSCVTDAQGTYRASPGGEFCDGCPAGTFAAKPGMAGCARCVLCGLTLPVPLFSCFSSASAGLPDGASCPGVSACVRPCSVNMCRCCYPQSSIHLRLSSRVVLCFAIAIAQVHQQPVLELQRIALLQLPRARRRARVRILLRLRPACVPPAPRARSCCSWIVPRNVPPACFAARLWMFRRFRGVSISHGNVPPVPPVPLQCSAPSSAATSRCSRASSARAW